ncbi:MAG: thioredoxin domain-containing protein [Desulfobacterales bacterium]|jgi:protein-disulfide isomerase
MTKKVHMPVLLILAITQLVVMGIAGVAESQEDGVIATLNGKPITLEEAQERVAFQIYRLRGNIYFLLKREIEQLVDQKLLAAEAARRGMSVDVLLRKEVDDKVPALSEKEVDDYLADHPEDAGKNPQSRNRIRIYLSQKARSQRKLDFMASLREKADFKFLLEPPQRPRTTIGINDEPWRGNPDAPVVFVHFASFTGELSFNSVQMIKRAMAEYPGKIKWIHRNFFRINDEKALSAAQMGEFAHEQKKFWDFHDRIFEFNGHFKLDDISKVAQDLGLNHQNYQNEQKAGRLLLKVKDDIRSAKRAGVTTVPIIFVNGLYFSPTFSYEEFRAMVNKELNTDAGSDDSGENTSPANKEGS